MKRIVIFITLLTVGILFSASAFSAKKKSDETPKKTSVKQEESKVVKKSSTTKESDSDATKAPVKKSERTIKSKSKSGVTSNSLKTESPLSAGDPEVPTSDVQTGEEINWQAITSGGGLATSTIFMVLSAIGQTAVGMATSTSFRLNSGFIQNFVTGCCLVPGDANHTGSVNISDATFLIAYIFSGGDAPTCCDEGDANGNGSINISDATFLIAYIFSGGDAPVCATPDLTC